jgi:hypothetical protein
VTREAAERAFAVVLQENAETCRFEVDEAKTEARRADVRRARLSEAKPVSDWLAGQRRRVLDKDFTYEVAVMYRGGMKLSERFAREFREFWDLPDDYSL